MAWRPNSSRSSARTLAGFYVSLAKRFPRRPAAAAQGGGAPDGPSASASGAARTPAAMGRRRRSKRTGWGRGRVGNRLPRTVNDLRNKI
jgi:hypothetical protein